MSHVDEGTLHAYLDGELEIVQPGATAALEAHVAACDECRARLEDERRIRDRAHAILGHAAPAALDVPPFDVVLRRARGDTTDGGAAPTSRPRRPFIPLAWAASIALALGAGWWAREMALAPEDAAFRVETMDQEAATGTAPVPPPVAAAPQALSAGSAATQADASTKPSDATQAGPAAAREAEPALAAGRAEDVSIAPTALQRGAIAATHARQRADSAERARVSAFAPPPAADSGGVAAEPELPTLKVTTTVHAAAVTAAEAVAWSAVDRSEAERRLGGKLLLAEGLEVASIEVADSAGLPLARSRQTIAPGVVLELLQRPAQRAVVAESAVEEAAAPRRLTPAAAPDASRAELVLERNGFLLTLRAGVSQDSLRALAARLR